MARIALLATLAALAAAPPAIGARAAVPSPDAPGLLSIGRYDHALVQLEDGTLRAQGGELLSPRLRIWRLPTRAAERVLPGLLARGRVRAVEPDRPITIFRAQADPLASLEYWRTLVGADRASPPGPGRPVTVLDTGLDLSHPEFAGRANTSVLGGQSLADTTTEFHGTAVSSLVGAQENGVGVVGVYPQAVVRSGDVRRLAVSEVIGALDAAIRAGPSVINMSFGVRYSRIFEDLVLTAFGSGSIIVAAAGNERQQGNAAASPANLNHVLTVAATDQQDRPTVFSTSSLGVDLAAPGLAIPAAVPTAFSASGYALMDGTSFSAPIVAGATAWVWTVRPDLDNTQVFDLMRYSARDVAPTGFDRDTGFGVLNIPAALTEQAPTSDLQEPNDDIRHVKAKGLFGRATTPITRPRHGRAAFAARLDVTEDPEDVYRVFVPARRFVRVTVAPDTDVDVDLWKPSTSSVFLRGKARRRQLFATSGRAGRTAETVAVRNRGRKGFYAYLDVYLPRNGPLDAEYRVSVATSR